MERVSDILNRAATSHRVPALPPDPAADVHPVDGRPTQQPTEARTEGSAQGSEDMPVLQGEVRRSRSPRSQAAVPEETMKFEIQPEFAERIHWNRRGSCGMSGCSDPECCCSFCARPIGVRDEDPRWDDHNEACDECDLCRDRVPVILWRGEGKKMEQAQFHVRCFEHIIGHPSSPPREARSTSSPAAAERPDPAGDR